MSSHKGNLNNKRQRSDEPSFIGKLESTIRHLPTSLNEKVVNTLHAPPYLAQYLHFFDFDARQQQNYLQQCEPMQAVYSRLYDELEIETFVGDWFEIDQDCIDKFAEVTGDTQWIHTDPERAKVDSPFRATISHGFLTLALIPMLTKSTGTDQQLYPEAKLIVNYGLQRVHFPFPVKSGKRVRARSKLISLVPMKRGLELVREITIEIENSSRIACVAEPIVRLYF